MEDLLLKEIKFYQVDKKVNKPVERKKYIPIKKRFPPIQDRFKHTRNNGK